MVGTDFCRQASPKPCRDGLRRSNAGPDGAVDAADLGRLDRLGGHGRNDGGGNAYDDACCRSLISGAASEPCSGLTAAEGQAEAERAVAGVRRACDAGYANLPWIRRGDPDLAPIRSRPDFQRLMMDLAFPAQPFANTDLP